MKTARQSIQGPGEGSPNWFSLRHLCVLCISAVNIHPDEPHRRRERKDGAEISNLEQDSQAEATSPRASGFGMRAAISSTICRVELGIASPIVAALKRE